MKKNMIFCGCGCGESITRLDNKGRERKFISGHNSWKYKGNKIRPCSRCKVKKPITEFRVRNGSAISWCRSCMRRYFRIYYKNNREKLLKKSLGWNKRNVQKKRQYNKKRHAENPEAARERSRRWSKDNKGKRIAYEHKREAAKRGNGGSFTEEEWIKLCKKYGNKCLKCGSRGPLQRDHVVPLALGGRNDIDNIQPLCGPCNFEKHTSVVDYR